jgi:acyl-CoA synthetase (AMP-forming)/AMP-acid ligase II
MMHLAAELGVAALVSPAGARLERSDMAALGPGGAVPAGAMVAFCLSDPAALIRCVVALDGHAGSMLLLSGALAKDAAGALIARAGADILVTDRGDLAPDCPVIGVGDASVAGRARVADHETRWLLTTSGTTGLPKIVAHTLGSLSRSVYRFGGQAAPVWGLLYDPTRFAGMQVTLQALIGGGTLVAADTHLPLAEQVAALAGAGVTHLSATPTLWRRLLMVPGIGALGLRQATLGGEIADQPVLDAVTRAFPAARVTHIYASTEAGVGFSVNDGQAGFPADYLKAAPGGVRLKLAEDMLWLKPPVMAPQTGGATVEIDAEGFVRSGDLVREEAGRIHFLGRENGLINVGGVKIYPETVENVVKTVPGVALVQVSAKKNPLTGTLVLAEVTLAEGALAETVRKAIQETCRAALVREAVPAIIRFVDGFETNAAGKLVRISGGAA